MTPYATVQDVKARTTRSFTAAEEAVMGVLLEDAAILIDNCSAAASADAKKAVSCRMVLRAMGDGDGAGIPIGASQGTVTAGPYSQTWTVGAGTSGEIYLSKGDRILLGAGDRMGAVNPLLSMVPTVPEPEPEPEAGQEPEDTDPDPAGDVLGGEP